MGYGALTDVLSIVRIGWLKKGKDAVNRARRLAGFIKKDIPVQFINGKLCKKKNPPKKPRNRLRLVA